MVSSVCFVPWQRRDEALHRQFSLLMRPAPDGGFLAVACNHAHALVKPGHYVIPRAGLEESDAILAARCKDAVARHLHLGWVRLAWNRAVAERKAQVTRA